MITKHRIESGQFVGQVDVRDGIIVATPDVWKKFKGSPLHRLKWWLAKCNGGCSIVRMPDLEDPKAERNFWTGVFADVVFPTYCGCNELLDTQDELEAHVERGCWRKV